MSGGRPGDKKAIFARLGGGGEQAAISLDRELFAGGIAHPDGAVTIRPGGVDLVISKPTS